MISETLFLRSMMKAVALIDDQIASAWRDLEPRIDDVPGLTLEERNKFMTGVDDRLARVRVECIEIARAAILSWDPDGDGEPLPDRMVA